MKKNEAQKIIKNLRQDFAKSYGLTIKKLSANIKEINYNSKTHEEIQEKIIKLSPSREQKQVLDLAENNLRNLEINLRNNKQRLAKIQKELAAVSQEGKTLKKKLPILEKANVLWEEKKEEKENIDHKVLDYQNQLGSLKQELRQIEHHEKELKTIRKEQADLQKEIATYRELSDAFGKKGIQAMIIEQSLASIEENANELLKNITDGRMNLRFITQKAKKSSAEETLIETLEIKINDGLGERDYEMYSGGEAFRINFAIRIALSKLLAAKAGVHLKFLAIDEGFGMLDTAGRDGLVAAINSIANEFEKILVITHLQELKDLFPAKIEVSKDESGSKIELVS